MRFFKKKPKNAEYKIYKECGFYSVYVNSIRLPLQCDSLESAEELVKSTEYIDGQIIYDSKREFICGGEI